MSDVEVTVESESADSGDTGEAIADAIDEVIEVNQSEDIGALKAMVAQLRSDVDSLMGTTSLHDDLISLHDHSELVTTAELTECEDRLAGMIEQTVTEPVVEETTDESSEDSSDEPDEPPNSRQNRRSIADMYYGKS